MSQITADAKANALVVYLPDTRGVTGSRFGRGNLKLGQNVFTYSRLPGMIDQPALGSDYADGLQGTCPGATSECQAICYAARPVVERGLVMRMWEVNSQTERVPDELPPGATLLRIHISGDFTTNTYIGGWIRLVQANPQVRFWAYTRSWRVDALLPLLEQLRALPNMQLFASMDISTREMPPAGWRIAWIDGDPRAGRVRGVPAHENDTWGDAFVDFELQYTIHGTKSLICPEETKAVANCEECGFCFDGKRNDVTFLKH